MRQNEAWKKQRVYKELKKCFTMVEEKYNGLLHLSRQIQGCCFFFFCSLITFSLWCLLQFADVVSNSCLPLVTLINGLAKAG